MPEINDKFSAEIKSFIDKIDAGTATRQDVKSLGWAGVEHDVEQGTMSKDNGTLPAYLEQLEKIVLEAMATNRQLMLAGTVSDIKNETQLFEIAEVMQLALDANKKLVADRDAALQELKNAQDRLRYVSDAIVEHDMMKPGCSLHVDPEHRISIVLKKVDDGHLVKVPTNREMDQFDGYFAKTSEQFEKHFLTTDWGKWLAKYGQLS